MRRQGSQQHAEQAGDDRLHPRTEQFHQWPGGNQRQRIPLIRKGTIPSHADPSQRSSSSGGDVFGGTQIAFTDVLGDQQFTLFASSIAQYRTIQGMWINLERRLNLAAQGYSQTQFFFGQLSNVFYDPIYSGIIDRDLAVATRTTNGGTAYAIYPFNRYRRIELYGGVNHFRESFADQGLQQYSQEYQEAQFGRQLFNIPAAVVKQMCARGHTTTKGVMGLVLQVEPKREYKARVGASPDETDSLMVALETARSRVGFTPLPPVTRSTGDGDSIAHWLRPKTSFRGLQASALGHHAHLS